MELVVIRAMRAVDWDVVAAIYAEGIATRLATFETEVPSTGEVGSSHLQDLRLVACREYSGWLGGAVARVGPVRLPRGGRGQRLHCLGCARPGRG